MKWSLRHRCNGAMAQLVTQVPRTASWASVTSGIPQGSVLRPFLFINDINVGLNNFISKFADDAKIAKLHNRWSWLIKPPRRPEKYFTVVQKGEMPFNVNKCPILNVGTRNQKFYYEMNGIMLDSVQCVKDLGISIATNLKFPRQCKDAAGKANKMLGFIKRNFSFKNKYIIRPLYISLVRLHLEYAIQFWSPHHTKNMP